MPNDIIDLLRTGCGVSRAVQYDSKGVCLVSTCSFGYKPSTDKTQCESERTCNDDRHNMSNYIINRMRPGCGVTQVTQYEPNGLCLVSTCSSGYKPSTDKKQCAGECN